jgi:hypothetical protein
MTDLDAEVSAKLDEAFKQVTAQRDTLAQFYDARLLLACYVEVVSSLAASLIHVQIYSRVQVAHLLADMLADSLTRESRTQVKRIHGNDVIEGGKQ